MVFKVVGGIMLAVGLLLIEVKCEEEPKKEKVVHVNEPLKEKVKRVAKEWLPSIGMAAAGIAAIIVGDVIDNKVCTADKHMIKAIKKSVDRNGTVRGVMCPTDDAKIMVDVLHSGAYPVLTGCHCTDDGKITDMTFKFLGNKAAEKADSVGLRNGMVFV